MSLDTMVCRVDKSDPWKWIFLQRDEFVITIKFDYKVDSTNLFQAFFLPHEVFTEEGLDEGVSHPGQVWFVDDVNFFKADRE